MSYVVRAPPGGCGEAARRFGGPGYRGVERSLGFSELHVGHSYCSRSFEKRLDPGVVNRFGEIDDQ